MSIAEDLQTCVKEALADTSSLLDTAEGWLFWFRKRADRNIKEAAKLGYSEITMDLPIQIGQSFDKAALTLIQKTVRDLLNGCFVGFVEDEYGGRPVARLYISWLPLDGSSKENEKSKTLLSREIL
jgi:hypothetical protein